MSSAAFAPFGSVIALNDAPVPIEHSYPADTGAVTGISVFRATQKVGLERGKEFDVRLMERHPYTSQVFIPMGKAEVSYCLCERQPSKLSTGEYRLHRDRLV